MNEELSAVVLCPNDAAVSPMDALEKALSETAAQAGREFVAGTLVFFIVGNEEAAEVLGMDLPKKTTLWQGTVLTRPIVIQSDQTPD